MSSATQAQILIAEDDEHTRNLLREVCGALGHAVRAAEDGEEALAAALEGPAPDLLLLDVMMPRLDGFEVLRRLRANPATRDSGVILLTAHGDIDAKLRGIELGADDYVTKPFRIADLQRRIESVLDKRRYRSELKGAPKEPRDPAGHAPVFLELKRGLETSVEEARRQGRPLVALFVAVDDYPMAFEGLGAERTATLLGEVAARLGAELRELDRLYRIDLEAFVVLMPDTTCEAAQRVAERLMRAIQEGPAVTLSVGLAGFPTFGVDKPEDLVRAANRALMAARRLGAGSFSIA